MATDLTFTKDKETKRKIRFTLDEGPVVGNLYVDKDDVGKYAKGDKLVVTLKEAK